MQFDLNNKTPPSILKKDEINIITKYIVKSNTFSQSLLLKWVCFRKTYEKEVFSHIFMRKESVFACFLVKYFPYVLHIYLNL